MTSPREIIAQAMWRHNSVIENGEVVKELYPQDEFDCCADVVLDALDAAGVLVIDPTDDELVTEIAKQLLDFAYAIEESSVGDHGYMAVLEVRRVLRAAGKATQ